MSREYASHHYTLVACEGKLMASPHCYDTSIQEPSPRGGYGIGSPRPEPSPRGICSSEPEPDPVQIFYFCQVSTELARTSHRAPSSHPRSPGEGHNAFCNQPCSVSLILVYILCVRFPCCPYPKINPVPRVNTGNSNLGRPRSKVANETSCLSIQQSRQRSLVWTQGTRSTVVDGR